MSRSFLVQCRKDGVLRGKGISVPYVRISNRHMYFKPKISS